MSSKPVVVMCPHCNEYIVIQEINCNVFRHGVFKKTGEQIPPHSSKEACDEYVLKQEIYGCGKPFSIDKDQETLVARPCDYV